MPDLPVESAGGDRYPHDMATRVALLEQIAQADRASFDRIERRLESMADQQRADFRWLLGIMLGGFGALLGVMAHGFHWL